MCGCWSHHGKGAPCNCACHTRLKGRVVEPEDQGCPCDRCGKHHPDATCTEPEDNDDLYVEPEPLKEGDWVQVWAQVNRLADDDGDLLLVSRAYGEAAMTSRKFYTRSDAIVRPDAGQVPPWVKPERCTSLKARTDSEGETVFLRCHLFGNHVDHGSKFLGGRYDWTTAEEHGRITEGGVS